MPPSPPPDHTQPRVTFRRSSSLPPATFRGEPPASLDSPVIRRMAINTPGNDSAKHGLEIEELSPEAMIPDSVVIYRDPEIEIPEKDDTTETDLQKKFTEIDLDRMRDDSHDETNETTVENTRQTTKKQSESRKRRICSVDDLDSNNGREKKVRSTATLSSSGDPGGLRKPTI
jgi:hypothetical protein